MGFWLHCKRFCDYVFWLFVSLKNFYDFFV